MKIKIKIGFITVDFDEFEVVYIFLLLFSLRNYQLVKD